MILSDVIFSLMKLKLNLSNACYSFLSNLLAYHLAVAELFLFDLLTHKLQGLLVKGVLSGVMAQLALSLDLDASLIGLLLSWIKFVIPELYVLNAWRSYENAVGTAINLLPSMAVLASLGNLVFALLCVLFLLVDEDGAEASSFL